MVAASRRPVLRDKVKVQGRNKSDVKGTEAVPARPRGKW